MYKNTDKSPMQMISEQEKIVDSVECFQNTIVAATRRGGKTKTASACVIAKFLEPNTETMILAPQHSLCENIFFNNVWRFIRDNELETIRANIKDRIIEGANGSILYARSLQRATSIVGVGLDLAVLDEIALTDNDDFWEQELQPTLTEKQGHTLWISTPRGFNHFKDRFDQGCSSEFPDWNSIKYTVHDLPYIDDTYVEKLKTQYEKSGRMQYYRQEFLASFEAFEGQIFSIPPRIEEFDRDAKFDMVIAGLDVGFSHSTAFIVIGVAGNTYYVLDYYIDKQKLTREHAEKIRIMEERFDIDVIYIDYAAAQFAWDLVAEYDITTMPAIKHVLEGIAHVADMIGSERIVVHPDLWNDSSLFKKQLTTYRWEESKEAPVKLDDDLVDAFRYALYTFDTRYGLRE